MFEAALPTPVGELGVPCLHELRFHCVEGAHSIAPLRMVMMHRSPVASLFAVRGYTVLLRGALLVAAPLKILLVQLIGRDHLYAVF